MANRPGEQTDKTMNREIKPNAGCDIFGRQYAQHDNPYGSGYQDVEFEQFNQLLPQDAVFNETNATPGEGRFRNNNTAMDDGRSEKERLSELNVISNDEAQGGFVSKRSAYFVGPDQRPDGKYGDDGMGPYASSPDRTNDTQVDFRKGKR